MKTTTTLRIFVAGPTDLKTQRVMVRTVANTVQSECDSLGHHVRIVVTSCDDSAFTSFQDDFDTYIADHADLVFFILKDTLKGETKKEYKKAAKQYAKNQKPVFYVFLKQYQTHTQEIKDIEDVMQKPKKAYYTQYSDDNDLKEKIKDQIEKHVNKRLTDEVKQELEGKEKTIKEKEDEISQKNEAILRMENEISKMNQTIKEKENVIIQDNKSLKDKEDTISQNDKKINTLLTRNKRNQLFLTILLSTLALGLIGYLYQYLISKPMPQKESEPMLVFAGGGSVYNYIHENLSIDLRDYDNAIYINQPSGNAWTLLLEEGMSKEKKFCAVCLSADVIDTTDMSEKYNEFFNKGRIVQLLIGHDPLVIHAHKDAYSSISGNSETVTIQRLCDFIKDSIMDNKTDKFRLFSTSRNSGTLRTYQHYISKEKKAIQLEYLFDNKKCFHFYDVSSDDHMCEDNKLFIALGSEYYKPKKVEDISKHLILKDKTVILKKPLYIYFIATSDGDKYIIHKRIIDFLNKIKAKEYIDSRHWKTIIDGYIMAYGDSIISINDTVKPPYTVEKDRLNHLDSLFNKKRKRQ